MDTMELSGPVRDLLSVLDGSDGIFLSAWDRPRAVRHKGKRDLVTDTDLAIEEYLKQNLCDIVPGASFMAEESAKQSLPSGTCWIIDPVDGTTNFAHHFGDTATSVALWENGQVVFGAVSAPVRGERYVAERNRGAWLNGSPIHVSSVSSCGDALVATGFPYSVHEDMDEVLRDLRILLDSTVGVRRCGSAALDMCFVACGSFEAYFEGWIKPWDIAAGWLLVEEAGGRVSGRSGAPYLFHTPILASNGAVHEDMVKALLLENTH
ncbi:inositol monophosphatase family protein [Mailhella massiliensis]|uniref:Inositol-1-monophosphatase n=1 Tax=Mailhella massiliensis TaxID=1903261 RepID=A0A921AYR7_9BACT|nr:inositol monophosphatase family protein [Mailhella massiliensis]HJD98371.1 inositol monophosphatase [Mailhella massiliensis]